MTRYIKNLRSCEAKKTTKHLSDLSNDPVAVSNRKSFSSKAEFKDWCADNNTDHVFYSYCEGDSPAERISNKNTVNRCFGFVADYDAPINYSEVEDIARSAFAIPPTWVSQTFSGYVRFVWEFESIPVDPGLYDIFIKDIARAIKAPKAIAGFDESSYKPNQYFELGSNWIKTGDLVPQEVVRTSLLKAAGTRPPASTDTTIPIDHVATAVEDMFPGRWVGDFEVGSRGPLFWIDDGIDREGCQISEDGVICYSDRGGKGFFSWREILGSKFVEKYEQKKLGNLLDEYWFNGKSFFKMLNGMSVSIPKDQLILELRAANFATKAKKGSNLSEVEQAILAISNQNRVDEIAPIVFSKDRVVVSSGRRILNSSSIQPVEPAENGDPSNWPFIYEWLSQMFADATDSSGNIRPATDYLYAWLKRFYEAVLDRRFCQGQALLLVGPTNKGKSLLSNKVISSMVGGLADASDYLSGQTKFNKDLAQFAAWVIDDTVSAANFSDQRKATELIKRAVANPRIEYHAKYVDAVNIPWTGRVILSLNMDANSLSVIPALDSSNRDKLLALRVRDEATSKFPPNNVVEDTVERELPHFCRYILDWKVPQDIEVYSRFGIESYIDEAIASAAYDNSSRSSIAELVEFFAVHHRNANNDTEWSGTITQFQVLVQEYNNGRHVGQSSNLEFVRRGMSAMEEAYKSNQKLRPVRSIGSGGGKVWIIGVAEQYDIARNLINPNLTS